MKFNLFITGLIHMVLLFSCREAGNSKEKLSPTVNTYLINDFIPEVPAIPEFKLKPAESNNIKTDKYPIHISKTTDSIQGLYINIKDTEANYLFNGHLLKGKKNGWWEVYSDSSLLYCGNFVADLMEGYWKYYLLESHREIHVNFKSDTLHGYVKELTSEGIILREGFYRNGYKNDYWKVYFTDGNPKEKGNYADGKKTGWWLFYNQDGSLKEEANFANDEPNGFVKKYLNGIIREEGKQIKNRKYGSWKYYDESGKLLRIQEHGR